jgi:hypothetical protein
MATASKAVSTDDSVPNAKDKQTLPVGCVVRLYPTRQFPLSVALCKI